MQVFLIEPSMTMNDNKDANTFFKVIIEQLCAYGIQFTSINGCTINRCKNDIDKNSILVLFNKSNEEPNKEIKDLLEKAINKGALIWPIALNKDNRLPYEIISDKQAYDVSEQLRARNLGVEYLTTIAKIFSRKIISYVFPTIYRECGMIFISHRRVDGEEIAADLCDQISIQAKNINAFRDITQVQVGEGAQNVIDKAMEESDVFIFLHTDKAADSQWIQKELRYALIRNIPIIWVRIDNASISKLSIIPSEKPHLCYNSADLMDKCKLPGIVDEILHITFQAAINRNNKVCGFLDTITSLFNEEIRKYNGTNMIYSISMKRRGYHYPQREIKQYFQVFGRTPIEKDVKKFKTILQAENGKYDSAVIVTDRIVTRQQIDDIVIDSMEDFYYHWNEYINPERKKSNMEIIISGAFPDGEEVYKQTLMDALIIFAKSILKHGYTLTFGAHPTFQKLFIEVAKEVCPNNYNEALKMYISKWFENSYQDKKEFLQASTQLYEIDKSNTLNESLTIMRKEMIQRKEVAAIICLGGKIKEDKSQEGIREEIQLAKDMKIPVFIVGSVGGCSSEVALENKVSNWDGLNDAPIEINKHFMESLDFFNLAQKMLLFLNNKNE